MNIMSSSTRSNFSHRVIIGHPPRRISTQQSNHRSVVRHGTKASTRLGHALGSVAGSRTASLMLPYRTSVQFVLVSFECPFDVLHSFVPSLEAEVITVLIYPLIGGQAIDNPDVTRSLGLPTVAVVEVLQV